MIDWIKRLFRKKAHRSPGREMINFINVIPVDKESLFMKLGGARTKEEIDDIFVAVLNEDVAKEDLIQVDAEMLTDEEAREIIRLQTKEFYKLKGNKQ